MDITTADAVRDELLREDQGFRELVQQHQVYEKRLDELSALSYPNEDELAEESVLKKKKLMVKDEIYSKIENYSKSH